MPLPLSVVICSHNPRPAYLAEVMAALREQTLPLAEWELIVIDNASKTNAIPFDTAAWHPRGRVVIEPTLGLTQARLRGISEAAGNVIVFVDDDNVLAADYLAAAVAIGIGFPQLGAWGGAIHGRFEIPPPAWVEPYLCYLAIAHDGLPKWGNHISFAPSGAAICVRRQVGLTYAAQLSDHPIRRQFDRIGDSLSSSGDTDLAWTALDIGLGLGRFNTLQVTHLIPRERLSLEYLLKLLRSISRSGTLLRAIRSGAIPLRPSLLDRALRQWRLLGLSKERRQLEHAIDDGHEEGRRLARTVLQGEAASFYPARA